MTFWGVEVKPGKPFTFNTEDLNGKLILTRATLGTGSATRKSTLQVNVGDKSPVFLCSLLPDKSGSCSLNLEFEEDDDVKFSVVGPTSIHLSGFVQAIEGHHCDSDSYGEDIISETESDSSETDSEEYRNNFIDDDDVNMFPPSSARNSGVFIEEIVDDEKDASENGGTKQEKKKKKKNKKKNKKKQLDDEQKRVMSHSAPGISSTPIGVSNEVGVVKSDDDNANDNDYREADELREEVEVENPFPTMQRPRRSKVWDHYLEREVIGKEGKIRCKYCNTPLAYPKNNSTSALLRHQRICKEKATHLKQQKLIGVAIKKRKKRKRY